MKEALEYCSDDLKGSVSLSDLKDTLSKWDEFQKKLKVEFEEAVGEMEAEEPEDEDEDEDEE